MNPFDFLNSINDTKKDLIKEDPQVEKDYAPFIANKSLSYFHDTLFFANEMNLNYHLPKKMQYDFLLYSITKKKRFSKWHKADKVDLVDLLCREYSYSKKRAIEVIDLLSKEQIDLIKEKYNTGGR
jgi:hypothetical protein